MRYLLIASKPCAPVGLSAGAFALSPTLSSVVQSIDSTSNGTVWTVNVHLAGAAPVDAAIELTLLTGVLRDAAVRWALLRSAFA